MDFLDPVKKRRHRIRLYVGYFLVSIVILAVSYLLVLTTKGLDYDRRTGQIIQNGLMFVNSHPVSADVYVNNEHKGNTNLKLTIPEGNYKVDLKARGYRNWSTTVNLTGADVERLDYPLLIPQKLTAVDSQLYAKPPTLATSSLDRHWLLILQPDSLLKFDMFDITKSPASATTLTLPTKLLKTVNGVQSLKAIEWASDNQHVLLEHDYKSGSEFIVMDRLNPSRSLNINDSLGIAPTSLVLRNKQFDKMYAYIGKTKTLLAIDTGSRQITTVLKDVIDYKASGANTVIYTSDISKLPDQYSVNMWDGQRSYLLHNYPANTPYKLEMALYSGQTFVAVAPVSRNKVYIYKNPLPIMKVGKVPNPFIALKINNPQFVSFSLNFRFIVAQSGNSFAGYDFEEDLWHYFTLKEKIPPSAKAVWMDGYHMNLNIDKAINLFDFNGGNQQTLSASQADLNGYFNSNYNRLYTIAPSTQTAKQTALTTTPLIVPK